MFPPETSLIPVTVALARFVESNGLLSMFGHYPYWYLGVPYQYLTGPIVPLLQVFLHKILPGLSLFDVTYLLLLLSFLASILGWGILTKKISGKSFIGYVVGLLLIILPWRLFTTLTMTEASSVIAKSLLPYSLIAFWYLYKSKDKRYVIYSIASLSVLLLINTSVFTVFLVSISGLILAASYKKGSIKKVTPKVKSTALVVLVSLFVVTLWYGMGYWVTVIANPSIGGASGIKTFLRIFDLLRASLPLILALVVVYFSDKIKSKLTIFSLVWTLTFLFLTTFRFIGDPDFWQDWTAWLSEIEIGIALLASNVILDLRSKILDKKIPKSYYVVLASLLSTFLVTNNIYGVLNKPKLISNTIPRGVQSLEKLAELTASGSTELTTLRVFISGSTVFWANAIYDLNQVRGGVDKAATHPYWDHAAFQLREGHNPELARSWLESLGVSYVLVHTHESTEVYQDFRNIDKWNKVGEIVWEEKGDVIIKVDDSNFAWVVDTNALDKVKSPQGGTDIVPLSNYLKTKKRPLMVTLTTDKVKVFVDDLKEGEGIVVAKSFSRNWKATDGSKIEKDPLGNILLKPLNYSNLQEMTITYH